MPRFTVRLNSSFMILFLRPQIFLKVSPSGSSPSLALLRLSAEMHSASLVRSGRCALPRIRHGIRSVTARRISSSAPLYAITPESPSWLEVPEPIQAPKPPKAAIKGILPIPRQIIKDRSHKYKATDRHLDTVAAHPKPKKPVPVEADRADQAIYHRQVSSRRREHIREGIKGIFERRVTEARKENKDHIQTATSLKRARTAPPRLDEVLTQQSIPEVVRMAIEWRPRKKQFSPATQQKRKARVQQRLELKIQNKMKHVHTLYLNARNFIVDQEQLDERIDKAFGSDEDPIYWNSTGMSVWHMGPPSGLKDLAVLGTQSAPQDSLLSTDSQKQKNAMMRRMLSIAGELTGGKIEVPEEIKDSHPRV
jgi:hypothetical protein